ncbi:uncharacterized protein LOC141857462 [Brevipalpus obovatus]|uniref:uncharacterized protein LOC141857462 n=1 Tax=Brevipalpus obovatus TaxID=246614 RepID=UPI003D9E3E67
MSTCLVAYQTGKSTHYHLNYPSNILDPHEVGEEVPKKGFLDNLNVFVSQAKDQLKLFRHRDKSERLTDYNLEDDENYELPTLKTQPGANPPDLIGKLQQKEDAKILRHRAFLKRTDTFIGEREGLSRYVDPDVCACCNLSKRYTIAFLTSIGFIISFGIRCNLGVASLKMFNETNSAVGESFEFDWTSETVSFVDSAFFAGYLVTQVPGGFMASKYPANRVFGTAIAISAFLNLFLPGSAYLGSSAFIFIRILQGLVEGVTYPACHGIWRHWAPPVERSRLATLAFCGSYAGAVLGLPISGFLTEKISWKACFYFYGVCGLAWYALWLIMSFEKPAKHPTISQEELMYIEESIGNVSQTQPTLRSTPWKKIFTSMPVHAIIVANFCRSWTFYLLLTKQPEFFKVVFHSGIGESGTLGALPHLCMSIVVPIGGQLADHLRRSGKMTTTNVRKLFNCGGFGMEAFFLFIVGMSSAESIAVPALTIAVGFSGFAISGFNVNHLDIAPRYASILMGISNAFGTIAGMLCPIVTTMMTRGGTAGQWRRVFLMAGFIHACGVIFYAIFASGELQSWSEPPPDPDHIPNWKLRQMSIKGVHPPPEANGDIPPSDQTAGGYNYYGATGQPAGYTASGAPIQQQTSFYETRQEYSQPQPTDRYMHGSISDREYSNSSSPFHSSSPYLSISDQLIQSQRCKYLQDKINRNKLLTIDNDDQVNIVPTNKASCEPTFDGILCWEPVASGTVHQIKCSNFLEGSHLGISHDGYAIRECYKNGSWAMNNVTGQDMGDYSGCNLGHDPSYDRALLDRLIGYLDKSAAFLFDETRIDSIQSVHDALRECVTNVLAKPPLEQGFTNHCPRTFDGWSCWNDTAANSTAYAPCPHFVKGFLATDSLGSRECGSNGMWFNQRAGRAWSNYTTCVDREDLKFRKVSIKMHIVGYSISVLALILSLIIFVSFKSLRGTRIVIHKNLFISFIINNVMWIIWYTWVVDDGKLISENPWHCQLLHILVQYFLLANYSWMFCEGLYLFTLLVVAFVAEDKVMKWFYVIGWGIPLILISLYTGFRSQGSSESDIGLCWIEESRYLWWLKGPVIFSFLLNIFFLIIIVIVLVTKMKAVNSPDAHRTRKAVKATLILLPLLGLTYLFTPFRPQPGTLLELIYEIGSALVASLQGLCVAFLFCFCNGEVINKLRSFLAQQMAMRSKPPFKNNHNRAQNSFRSTIV